MSIKNIGQLQHVMMIAFHFPPFSGSSGVQRSLRFCQYLPQYGWQPIILTANPQAYEKTARDQLPEISIDTPIVRAFALDTARHLSIRGRYLNWMALPDRWISWVLGAVPHGLALIRKYRPQVIWSTYPISTAHLIASILHRLTGIPWVADFRDPIVEYDPKTERWAPKDATLRRIRLWIERTAAHHATHLVFCTEGARQICVERYPQCDHQRWVVIQNGYDEPAFRAIEQKITTVKPTQNTITLLHSGMLYYSPDRDPSAFFAAIGNMKASGELSHGALRVILRASGYEEQYRQLIHQQNIDDIVFLDSPVSYEQALREMIDVDGLLLFQGYTSNPAIPAKAYEYLRAGKPILALVDDQGETAHLLRKVGAGLIAPMQDIDQIEKALRDFMLQIRQNQAPIAKPEVIACYSREFRTKELADLLTGIM